MAILFYSTSETPYGCFSNFSAHGFDLDGVWWPTSEHYFQAQKFIGTIYVERLRQLVTPNEAARYGRKRSLPLRADWNEVKDEIMLKAVLRKFEVHDTIRAILLGTDDEMLVENTSHDYYWGCGTDGSGLNMLGKTLMQVRQILAERISSP